MRYREITEGYVDYKDGSEMLAAAESVCAQVKQFSADKPINIELKPEMAYGHCHGIVLTDLFAHEPGQGAGTPVMQYLLDLADRAGLNVYTDAQSQRSAQFYERLGFEKDPRSGHQFVKHASFDYDAWADSDS